MKKLLFFSLLIAISIQSAFAQNFPVITSWDINTSGATGYAGILSNCQTVQFDSNNVYISCTCIPGYSIGPWTGDPNIPANQNFVYKMARNPQQNTGTLTAVGLGHIGVWSNGVSIFNSQDANSYNNLGYWHQNAYYFEGSSFDNCLGHPQQNGEYHTHVNPKCVYNDLDSTHHSPIIGYAFDGYPVYGAYGYANTDGTGGIKRMTSSYQLRTNMVNRDTLPNGTILSSADYGPPVSTSYPLGDYTEDYLYTAGSGTLDAHNGRFCVTPDYPLGTYAYFVTIDSHQTPVYPYTIGLTYYGVVQTGNTGPGSGHNTPPNGTKVYVPPTTTGVAEINKSIKFTIEPNPTKDFSYIYFDALSDNNITATLFNVQGKLLKTYNNWHTSIGYAVDMTAYPAGMYFLHLQTAKNYVVQKIIKIN
ncbi:MAG TPA: YHYH protein [Bacteroidia bacterium]|nr:YHYH protein [Bacteroidia bacterium]